MCLWGICNRAGTVSTGKAISGDCALMQEKSQYKSSGLLGG